MRNKLHPHNSPLTLYRFTKDLNPLSFSLKISRRFAQKRTQISADFLKLKFSGFGEKLFLVWIKILFSGHEGEV
jgi:hypothetical protein